MGTGITAAIPLVFNAKDNWVGLDKKYLSEGFLNNYNEEIIQTNKIYTIKQDLLINNYKSFLEEFYRLIGEDFKSETNLTFDTIPNVNNIDDFSDAFSRDKRYGCVPFTNNSAFTFSTLECICKECWLFYIGSYKAYLEEYSTLLHFERVLAKAMNNPLGSAVKFGIYG